MLDYNSTLTLLTLLLTILIFWRSIVFRRRYARQSDILKLQTSRLQTIQEIEEEALVKKTFQTDLQHAEVTTELQKPRSTYSNSGNRIRPPERYQYARSMYQSGMETDEISSALGMSAIEISQVLKLARLSSCEKISNRAVHCPTPA